MNKPRQPEFCSAVIVTYADRDHAPPRIEVDGEADELVRLEAVPFDLYLALGLIEEKSQ